LYPCHRACSNNRHRVSLHPSCVGVQSAVCDKCKVTVTSSRVRRERLGHIDLAVPVAHIWFYRVNPCRIALMLGITSIELKNILFYEKDKMLCYFCGKIK
jgi:DNA-directed RNA polymerase beta' subunit